MTLVYDISEKLSFTFLHFFAELFTYTYSLLHGDLSGLQEYLMWALGFGPITFPFSLVGWHIYQVYKGEEHFLKYENIARSRVLTSLSVLTKSAIQLGLQTTIIMIRWDKNTITNHVYQMISVSISLIGLAKSCADHHYFESSGKNVQGKKKPLKSIFRRCI